MPPTKHFFDAEATARELGISARHMSLISEKAGVIPHNFGGPGVRWRYKWTPEQIEKIRHYRATTPKEKPVRRRNR